MADTSRTVTDMASNLFQDRQAAGSITPQDLRDFLSAGTTPFNSAKQSRALWKLGKKEGLGRSFVPG